MSEKDTSFYRKRIAVIYQMVNELNNDAEFGTGKNSPRELLKNGFIHEKIKDAFDKKIKAIALPGDKGEPLTFTELTSLSTWFAMHPEKIAGKEIVTTSFHFPLEIEGTKEDIIRTIKEGINSNMKSDISIMRLRLELRARALRAKLKLQSLDGCNCALGGLSTDTNRYLDENEEALKEVIEKSQHVSGLSGLGKAEELEVLSFDEVVKQYNQGISNEEIKAWVWYKKNKGEPMRGWGKYADVKDSEIDKWIKKGILFYHNNDLLPFPAFTFGNMYDRTLQLENDKEHIVSKWGEEAYTKHKQVIDESKPRPLSVLDPDKRNRPKILAISSFARDFKVKELKEDFGILNTAEEEHSLQVWFEQYLKWLQANDKKSFKEVSSHEIWEYYIEAKNLRKSLSEDQKEIISKYAPLEGEELFARFLHEALNVEDQQKLDMLWNRTYNGWSSVPYHRIPVGFVCSSRFKLGPLEISPIQREGIAFMKAVGSGIIAYDVGVGKTMTAIVTLANEMYSGKCSRPVIVCPNGVYEKWKREIFGYTDEKTGDFVAGVLSGTGITVNDWHNLGKDVIGDIDVTKAVKKQSITMLTYEGFAKLGFGQKVMDGLFHELKKLLAQAAENVDDGKSMRDLEKIYQGYRDLIGIGNKGSICDIETVGFDYVVIDEAHNFKNVFSYVPTDPDGVKRYKIQSSDSARGKKAFFICNYIQRKFGANVMGLTATPFTNNPMEVFSMLSLVGYENMQQMGVYNLFSFMETFILQSVEYVNSYDGTIQLKNVVKAFNNRLVLQKLIYNHISYKTGEEAGVKRPCKINIPKITTVNESGQVLKLPKDQQLVSYLQMNDEQQQNQLDIIRLAQTGSTPIIRMKNVMKALGQSLDNALSPFLYEGETPSSYKEFVDSSPKIRYVMECISSVKQYHESAGEPMSGQVIYINRGKDYFRYIKEYLEEELGFKKKVKFNGSTVDEVEIITSEVSQDDREYIKDAFLEGYCKVIIGTATIREGIDLQKNGSVLYNCYPDWNPTDVKQLEGRIWRQGNQFGYVRVIMPLVQDSMDVFVFQKLEEKTARVNDIWYRADRGNVLDVEALDPEEVKFALYTDLKELAKIVVERKLHELERSINVAEDNLTSIKDLAYSIQQVDTYRQKVKGMISEARQRLPRFERMIEFHPSLFEGLSKTQLDEYIERANTIIKEIEAYEASAPQDDKELIRLCNRLKNSIYRTKSAIHFSDRDYDMFKTYFSSIEKAKRTIMEPRGYSLDTDFGTIQLEIIEELNNYKSQLEHMKSQESMNRIIEEIQERKSQSKVDGREPEEAAEDFKKLNHLLQYKFNVTDTDTCLIPDKDNKPKKSVNEIEILRLRLALKARAIKIKLKLAA
jgi:superfamily II DNA or RNA helicase